MRVSRRAERRARESLQASGYLVLRARAPSLADFVAIKRTGAGPAVSFVRVTKRVPRPREVATLLREARMVGASVWIATVLHGAPIQWRRAGGA